MIVPPHSVIVTGGRGFIGSHLVRELDDAGHFVTVLDRADGDLLDAPPHLDGASVTVYRAIQNALVANRGPIVVVHLAAAVGRVFGEDDRCATIRSNGCATAGVAVACRLFGVRLVYTSTSEVYGDQGDDVVSEDSEHRLPHNLYGLTKRHGEEIAALYTLGEFVRRDGAVLPPCGLQIVRPSMPYGPGLPAGRGRAAIVNFLDQAARGVPITVHDPAERSWCWVGDLVAGFRTIIEVGDVADSLRDYDDTLGVYNVGNDAAALPMSDVAAFACATVGRSASEAGRLIRLVPGPPNQTLVKRLSMRRLRDLGWKPRVDLGDGLRATWNAMRTASPGLYPDPLPTISEEE